MKRIAFAFSVALAAALIGLAAHSFQAQDRQKDAADALARADAAFAEKRYADAADDYAKAAQALPQGDGRDRAIARELVCLAEAGRHADIESMAANNGIARQAARVGSLDARVDYLRLAGLYFAGRDHDFHMHDRTGQREYALDWDRLGKEERWYWSYRNTVAQDVLAARGLIESAHDASHTWLETNPGAPAAKQQRHVAITMEYCDLLEVNDRLNGKTRNAMHFFGSDYGVGGAAPSAAPEEVEEMPHDLPETDEDPPPAPKAEETLPQAVAPEQEPFTRRGYFLQPEYPNLRTINALMENAASRSRDLKDPALQSAVLYRRAMLLINVGLYGNADLNAKLTDWRKGEVGQPDISRDPRPLLRKLLVEYKGSIWDDEARFLLGYVAYYLNDFASARAEFAQLEKDYPKSRYIGEARRLVQVIEYPQLFTSFSTGGSDNALVVPGQALSISLFARNVESVRVSLRPLDLAKVMANAPNAGHAWADLAEIAKLPGIEAALGASVMDQSFHLGKDRPHFYQHREKLPLYTGTPGVFVLEVSGGPVLERKLVQIADLALQRRRLAGTEQFWVTTRDGRPLADVRIRGGYHENLHVWVPYRETVPVDPKDPRKGTEQVTRTREERRVVEHALLGATDNNGLYEAALPPHSIANFWATLDVEGRLYLVNDPREPGEIQDPAPWEPRPVAAPVADLKAFVYSDRPVYRPGDRAHLRIIARRPMGEGKLEGEPATLRVMADGVEQFRADVTLNEFGCATATFEVPVGAPLGRYELLLRSPRIGEQQFNMQVLEYFKKDVKLEVDAPRVALAPGSDATVDLIFSYHAGGAVQGAEVRYTVRARSADGKTWQPAAATARTNMDGRVAVRLDTQKISDEAGGRAVELSISADGTGPGGQTVHAVGTASISGSGIKVAASWPKDNWINGRRMMLELAVTDAQGRRLEAKGTYTIWRVTDQSSLDPAEWRDPSLRHLGEWEFAVGSNDESLTLNLPAQTGRYVLELEGKAEGEDFKLEHNVVSVAQGDFENRPFAIIPQFNQTNLVTPVRVLVCQPVAGDVLLSIHANGRERGHRLLARAPANGIHEVALIDSDTPQAHLCARAVRNGDMQADNAAVAVRPASRAIVTTVRFDKEKYRPGETATADVLTFDAQGRPVEAEVALAVWDSALKEFADSALERDLYDHFFSGSTQYIASDENLGRRTRVKPTRQNSARVKRWPTHAMPPGSFFYGAQCWTGTGAASLSEILDSIELKTFEGLTRTMTADKSMDANWDPVPPSEGDSPYYGESANQGMGGGGGSGGSGGFAYRRARGGGGRGASNAPERKDFADSAYFNPSIRTSPKGIAQVSFKLPDNLTEWTFEATATDRASAIGQTTGAFKSARDLGVRMVGPRGLTDGDEIELAALVQNLGERAMSVNTEVLLNVEGATAQLSAITPATPQTMDIAPGSAVEVRMRVRVAGTGSAVLKVSADSEEDADSLVWRYTVNPRGMFVSSTQTFRFDANGSKLDLKPDFPAGAVMDRSTVTLRFNGSLIGSVVDSLPGLVNYPHGCAEQTTNKFVPLLAVLSLLRAYKLDIYELGKARMAYDGPVEAENWPAELTNAIELQKMVDLGFGNLRRYQNYDGGWGWFGPDDSSPHLSATVLQGLCVARANARGLGLSLPASEAAMNHMFARGAAFAVKAAGGTGDDSALRARCLHAAALALTFLPAPEGEADPHKSLRTDLREALTIANALKGNGGSAELAALALAMHHAGLKTQAESLVKSLIAKGRNEGGGLVFGASQRPELRWHDTPVEAQALAVQAVAAIAPTDAGLKPAVNALMAMRRDGGWGSTRATGSALQGLSAYLAASPEQAAEARVRIDVGGQNLGSFERTRDKLISGRTRWDIGGGQWQGKNLPVTLTRGGNGEVSGTMTVRAFMPVTGAVSAKESGMSVRRTYMRRTSVTREVEVEVQDQRGNVLRRFTETRIEHENSVLTGGETLKVGDVLTVVLWVKAGAGDKYICIEDARPSCLEPISSKYELAPGSLRALGGIEVTKEERDTSTNFYAENVDSRGELSFRYDCVVVAPGKFSALPARAFDMYDESRNGHSESHVLEVK